MFLFCLAFDWCRFCGSAWSFGFFLIPATTANDLRLRNIFYPRYYPLHLCSYLNSWERARIFPFDCPVLNKGTTGTIFITSLVWRGPWLEIEPGTSRTRSQHSTTRLSRRRYLNYWERASYVLTWINMVYIILVTKLERLCSKLFLYNTRLWSIGVGFEQKRKKKRDRTSLRLLGNSSCGRWVAIFEVDAGSSSMCWINS